MAEKIIVPQEHTVTAPVATASPAPEPTPAIVDVNGAAGAKKGELVFYLMLIMIFLSHIFTEPPLQVHYSELLRVISDIGRDVKPAYTGSKSSTDKLRKSKLKTSGGHRLSRD